MKNRYILLITIVSIFSPLFAQSNDSTKEELSKVIIEQAEKTTSTKDTETGNSIINFIGDVILTIEKGDSKTKIEADRINYDRANDLLYASGGVKITRENSGEETEIIEVKSVLFNTKTQEGAFFDGIITQNDQDSLNLDTDSSLFISSPLFGREEGGSVTFNDAYLTFCDENPPHWKIKASRIWLLSNNEFSFANALLYVGEVPVMYFPFFYYPKDEMIFNPSFGYKKREGYFFQTTTYLLGRKDVEDVDEDDKLSFMKSTTLKKQERQGLFLHNLSEDATMPSEYIKILADSYSNLGSMIGVEGKLKPENLFKTTSFSVKLGFTNTLFPSAIDNYYINTANSGTVYYDKAWLFGVEWPFRFALDLDTGITFDNGSLSLALPIYSDSYFDDDFGDRNEYMDWINFLLEQSSSDDDDDYSDVVSGFTWKLSGSYSPTVTNLNPWITKLSISSYYSSFSFLAKTNDDYTDEEYDDSLDDYSPSRKFFYLSSIVPLDITFSLAGTVFELPIDTEETTDSSKNLTDEEKQELKEQQKILSNIKAPKEISGVEAGDEKEETVTEKEEETDKTELDTEKESELFEKLILPEISSTTPKSESVSESSFSSTWALKPDFSSKIANSSDDISQEDSLFQEAQYSLITLSSPVTLTNSLNLKGSWLKFSNVITLTPEYQTHPYLYDGYTDDEIDDIIVNDYDADEVSAKAKSSITFKPFIYTEIFKDTSVSWANTTKLIESSFIGTVDDPEWEWDTVEWDDDYITTHSLSSSLAIDLGYIDQTVSLSANLPPKTQWYTGSYKIEIPDGYVKVGSGYFQEDEDSNEWEWDSLDQSFSYTLLDFVKISESYEYDIEEAHNEDLSVSLDVNNLSIDYKMAYTYSKKFEDDYGWVSSGEEAFIPYSGSLAYSSNFKKIKNKSGSLLLTPKLNTSITWDMIRPTNSSFTFKPTISFKINDFVDLSFSSSSSNQVLLRYVQDYVKDYSWYTLPDIPGEENIFKDLFYSFAFWDDSLREASGFKIDSLTITLEHDLHDWTLNSSFSIEPQLITDVDDDESYYYDFSPYFTLSVKWNPMSSLDTVIEDEYGEFSLNP
ncbi:MAG: hypothetical protein BKP49_00690 [Treponema sp. CETP13]|nr:MAG: hypothetical protein BKP49_00690 [Treponema sp. CETP13]